MLYVSETKDFGFHYVLEIKTDEEISMSKDVHTKRIKFKYSEEFKNKFIFFLPFTNNINYITYSNFVGGPNPSCETEIFIKKLNVDYEEAADTVIIPKDSTICSLGIIKKDLTKEKKIDYDLDQIEVKIKEGSAFDIKLIERENIDENKINYHIHLNKES